MDNQKPLAPLANPSKVVEVNISSEMKTSFLSYAMSVIVARALPDVRDGLKPVHRRILFGMDELGVYPDKQYKKSARIVGDVMGKYHPHGDSAIYESMVRMAQDFSYRYPLVNGHGNFGSVDGDGAAAMRYTEAKMEKITMEMLRDLRKDTVDFVDNYDGSEQEPKVLPSHFPNLLVNGATGIAVGMATNIPPHNLGEVIDGYVALIHNPDITMDELMEFIKGPDFPTGGTILGLAGVREAYAKGRGPVRVKAKVDVVEMASGKKQLIVKEIPYQVNKTTLIEKIAELAKEKKVDGITDLRDESNRNGMRVVIELRRDANAEVVLNNLLRNTQLQITYNVNMLALVDDQPMTLSLKEILEHYYKHQLDVLIRRTRFDLDKATAREHLLKGFVIALDNIDALVKVIRESYDDTEGRLIAQFGLSEIQAKAILAMQLRRLSGLERDKIHNELKQIEDAIVYYNALLSTPELQKDTLVKDALDIKERFADPRRSDIDAFGDYDIEDEDLIPVEDVIVAVTTNGYVKRMNIDTYKAQNRGGRGKTGMKTNEDDVIDSIVTMSSHDYLLFFTTLGRVYKMKGYKVPALGRTSKGLPIVNLLSLVEGENLAAVMSVKNFDEGFLFFTTTSGVVKRTPLSDFQNIRTNGIRAVSLREGDSLQSVKATDGNREIIIGASNGKAIRFHETDVRSMGRNATGVKGIELPEGDTVIGTAVVTPEYKEILVITEYGYGKRTDVDEYRLQQRGGMGVKTINVTEKNGPLCKLTAVNEGDDLIVVTDKGMVIRVNVDQIAQTKRSTQGVRIINLVEGHAVATIALVDRDEEEDAAVDATETPEEDTTAAILAKIHKPAVLEFEDEPADEETETISDLMADSY
jgi:DNA gyrase subunit A